MKILKEEVLSNLNLNSYNDCKRAYKMLTGLTESDFKKYVSLKSDNDTSSSIKNILTSLAEIVSTNKGVLPEKQCKFLTNYYNNGKGPLDFSKLVKDGEFNLLRVKGMLAALMFKSVLRSLNTYYRFLSLFSPTFIGSDNIKNPPNEVSFIILNSFTEAFGINNISKTNKFIKDYVNNTYFDNYTQTREVFEKVYNDYVSNPSFNVKKIFSGDDSSKEDNKEIII